MSNECRLPSYGGQAVIEGVMMRGANAVAIAMRAPDQQIVIHKEPLGKIYKSRLVKIPFLRGLVMLWDALSLGLRALTLSANTQTGEEEKIEGPVMILTMVGTLAVAIFMFKAAPAALGSLVEKYLGWEFWAGNLVEGLARLLLLVGYIWAIGFMPDIRRVFAYHGAEHKTINAFEARAELTPENVSRYSVEHPRCGTAFLLTVVIFSVLLYGLLGPMPIFWRMASRILLLPVVVGISYEYIRWTANHIGNPIVRLLAKPNLALQHLTTREPSLEILEVSIAAFNAMRAEEIALSPEQSQLLA
ncbi:MAG: DUF1385 domain-containing protein [Anaerolineales bacterium]|nr:DUF1385 domain-containing protein [Anaerolineales bacterium]